MTASNKKLHSNWKENLKCCLAPLQEYFDDPDVTDIYQNPNGSLFVKYNGKPKKHIGDVSQIVNARDIISTIASFNDKSVYEGDPEFSGDIPYFNARIQAVVEPSVVAPSFIIRKHPEVVYTLDEYVDKEQMTKLQAQKIQDLILTKKNILVAGSMGTGKTTLLNALINEIAVQCPYDRLYIIEDTPEISCIAEDFIQINTPPDNAGRFVRAALRSSVDRIIFGELRYGAVALELLLAWNTGTPGGLATVHADSAEDAYDRVQELVEQAVPSGKVRDDFVRKRIHAVIYLERKHGEYPRVREIYTHK